MANKLKQMKIVIIILAILLGLSLTALAWIIISGHLDLSGGKAVVPDNYIEPTNSSEVNTDIKTSALPSMPATLCATVTRVNTTSGVSIAPLSKTVIDSDSAKETVISIYKNHAEDSEPFHLANMFPGDSETKAYLVEVSHKGTVTLRFHADILAGYEKLAEVLKCKVVLRNESLTLYDGLMGDMPQSIDYRISSVLKTTTELTYDITVYLDTGVGNEYMNKELVADFRWWVEESGGTPTPSPAPDDDSEPDNSINPDDGELVDPPQTGDNSNLYIWLCIAAISLISVIVLLLKKRRESYDEQEEGKGNEQ